jgi:hypothetical protein
MKENERKIAFICFYLFFGIGTFQWVTANKNKKKLCRFPPTRCSEALSLFSNRLAEAPLLVLPARKFHSRYFHFPQHIVALSDVVNCQTPRKVTLLPHMARRRADMGEKSSSTFAPFVDGHRPPTGCC